MVALERPHRRAAAQGGSAGEARPSWRRCAAEQARLLKRVAQLWIDKFSNHNQAVKPLEDLYAIDPDDAETVTSAARHLQQAAVAGDRCSTLSVDSSTCWKRIPSACPDDATRKKELRNRLTELAKLAQDRLGDKHRSDRDLESPARASTRATKVR
jgi:hypothetical protein